MVCTTHRWRGESRANPSLNSLSDFPFLPSAIARVRVRAHEGKVDVVRVELIPGMICGIWKQGFAGWKF